MDYKTLMKTLCTTLSQIKHTQENVIQRMKNIIPENMNSLRWYTVPGGAAGSGAGKGGGAGGSISEAGGSLGRFGAAQEEGYFFQKQKEHLKKLKEKFVPKKAEPTLKQNPK